MEAPTPTHHTCAVARPGDTLIVGLATKSTAAAVDRMAAAIKAGLPDGVSVCVIDNVSAFQVVRGGEN